jgi:hypothetical protein
LASWAQRLQELVQALTERQELELALGREPKYAKVRAMERQALLQDGVVHTLELVVELLV